MKNFDLAVIGSGPAGFSAASRALDFGLNVCIIEGNNIGGGGIVNGVLSSKTMYELSMDYALAARTDRGYRAGSLNLDFSKVKKTVIEATKEKQLQLLSQIETFAKDKSLIGSLKLIKGWASFVDSHTIKISLENGGEELIYANNVIIATGSKPRTAPGLDIDHKRIINSDDILSLEKFPERMLIVGSGIIGCEFATIFSNFNQTEVHLLDRSNRVLPYEDEDVSDFVAKNLEDNGVIIHHTANLRDIVKKKNHLEVILDYTDGHSKVIEVDVALISIGRIPNIKNIGLEKIGIIPDPKGLQEINGACMLDENPKHSHILAAGDVTGHVQLYNMAELQGRYAVKLMYENVVAPANYSSMSTLMFFKPLVAAVGMNETMLRNKKIPYKAAYYSNKLVNRTIAMQNTKGFVKLMISDDEDKKILGMRAAGPQASASIVSVAHIISKGSTLKEAMEIIYPHPSVTEGIQECLRVLNSESVFKPNAFPEQIKVWTWKPDD